jgi:hypothetical protein
MGIHQRIAGACLVLAIGALGAFMSMTPPEFTGARFALAAAEISLMVLYFFWVFSYPGAAKAQVFYGLFVAFILVFGVVYGSKWIDYREKTYPRTPIYAGILTPLRLIESGAIGNNVKIRIGNSHVFFNTADVFNDLLKTWSEDQFTVEILHNEVFVSTKIRDDNDNIIVELHKNEWKVEPPPGTWDRNYADDALEVKDAKGDVVLQIRVLSNVIQLQGVWWVNFGINGRTRMVVREAPVSEQAPGHHDAQFVFCPPGTPCKKIEPIFKYPSESHLGELR